MLLSIRIRSVNKHLDKMLLICSNAHTLTNQPETTMFDHLCVEELCDAIKKAFYDGDNDKALELHEELKIRLLYTSI